MWIEKGSSLIIAKRLNFHIWTRFSLHLVHFAVSVLKRGILSNVEKCQCTFLRDFGRSLTTFSLCLSCKLNTCEQLRCLWRNGCYLLTTMQGPFIVFVHLIILGVLPLYSCFTRILQCTVKKPHFKGETGWHLKHLILTSLLCRGLQLFWTGIATCR